MSSADTGTMQQHLSSFLAFARTSRGRKLIGGGSAIFGLIVLGLTARHFASVGWPLRDANLKLVGIAGGFFVLAYAFKAYGWQRLFRPSERPTPLALAAAGGAASITGAALPGRFDDVVRVAVVRRFPCGGVPIPTLALSLFMLGLIDAAALMPLSAFAAATSDSSDQVRAALGVIAAGGLGAGIVVAMLPRMVASGRLLRFRIARWLATQVTSNREAGKATLFVLASWTVRAVGLFFLLAALGVSLSFPLALAFLCATAASSALPISPVGGAATQAGAGAAILVASGVQLSHAVSFAIAAHGLFIVAGAAVAAVGATGAVGRRVVASVRTA